MFSGAIAGADVGFTGVEGDEDDNASGERIVMGPGAGGSDSGAVALAEPGRTTGFESLILPFIGPVFFLAST